MEKKTRFVPISKLWLLRIGVIMFTLSTYFFAVGCDDVASSTTSYNVTFNPNGGKEEAYSSYVDRASYTLPANSFTREGYTFIGWNSSADGTGTEYSDKHTVSLDKMSSHEFYAQWESNTTAHAANTATASPNVIVSSENATAAAQEATQEPEFNDNNKGTGVTWHDKITEPIYESQPIYEDQPVYAYKYSYSQATYTFALPETSGFTPDIRYTSQQEAEADVQKTDYLNHVQASGQAWFTGSTQFSGETYDATKLTYTVAAEIHTNTGSKDFWTLSYKDLKYTYTLSSAQFPAAASEPTYAEEDEAKNAGSAAAEKAGEAWYKGKFEANTIDTNAFTFDVTVTRVQTGTKSVMTGTRQVQTGTRIIQEAGWY